MTDPERKILAWRDVQGNRIGIVSYPYEGDKYRVFRGDITADEPKAYELAIPMSLPLSEPEARAEMDAIALHFQQKAVLGRRAISGGVRTAWGVADSGEVFGEGIISYSTSGHGGFKLDRKHNAMMPAAYRVEGGWYEEDCEWAKVAAIFPELFTDWERRAADSILRNTFPSEFEAVTGRVLAPGESRRKDELAFLEANKNNLIVISASYDDDNREMVKATATIGGRRGDNVGEETFLVEAAEYNGRGRFGFVIDRSRHRPYPEPAPSMGGPA